MSKLQIFEEDGITYLSCSLASILYNMDNFKYVDDSFKITNVGADAGSKDATVYASNHVYLDGASQSVDVPLDVVLGAELSTADANIFGNCSSANITPNSATVTYTTGDRGYLDISPNNILRAGNTYLFEINIDTLPDIACAIHFGDNTISTDTLLVGENIFEHKNISDGSNYIARLTFEGTADVTMTIDWSIKEITSVNTQTLLYYSPVDKEYKVIDDGTVSKELMTNGDFSDGLSGVTGISGTTLSIEDGKLNALIANQAGAGIKFGEEMLTVGKTYSIKTGEITNNGFSGTTFRFLVDNRGVTSWSLPVIDAVYTFKCSVANTTFYYARATVDSGSLLFDNISVKEVIPTSTKYNLTESFSQLLLLNVPITQVDLEYLNLNVNALMDMWTGRNPHDTLGITKQDMIDGGYYPANDVESGKYLQNLAVDVVDYYNYSDLTLGSGWKYNSDGVSLDYDATMNDKLKQLGFSVGDEIYLFFTITGGKVALLTSSYDIDSIYYATTGTHFLKLKLKKDVVDFYGHTSYGLTNINIHGIYKLTALEIANYTSPCRDIYHNTPFGATDIFYTKDNLDRLDGYVRDGELVGSNDGRFLELPLDPIYDYLVVGKVTKIKYDGTNLLVEPSA